MNNKKHNMQNNKSQNEMKAHNTASNCKHGHHCDKGDHNTRSMH